MTSWAQEFKEYVERRLASLEDVLRWRLYRRVLTVFYDVQDCFSGFVDRFEMFFMGSMCRRSYRRLSWLPGGWHEEHE